MHKLIGLLIVALLSLSGPAGAGPFEDGKAAYDREDYATALKLWRPLADQGVAEAQYWLGIMCDNGLGVPQDHAEAMKWFRKAAVQGDASAQLYLGYMYELGRVVPEDYVLAHMWFNLAAAQGLQSAVTRRDDVARKMTPVQIGEAQKLATKWGGVPQDYAEDVKRYRTAAVQGDASAQNNLGYMYELGRGVPQDYVLAHMWFNLAAAKGDKDAVEPRARVARKMTDAQIAEAQGLATKWKPTK